jgi:hypothetical protein
MSVVQEPHSNCNTSVFKIKWSPVPKTLETIKWFNSSDRMLALPNPVDNQDNKKFKALVLARHETVNRQIKHYNTMADTWKHGMDKHGIAIRAVVATVQYKMLNGSKENRPVQQTT